MNVAELRERLDAIKQEFIQIAKLGLKQEQWRHIDNALMMLKKLEEELKADG